MKEDRLRELEWAATYLTTHPRPRRCRCAGSCRECAEWARQERRIDAAAVLELVRELRSKTSRTYDDVDAVLKRFRDGQTTSASIRLYVQAFGCGGGIERNGDTVEHFQDGGTLTQKLILIPEAKVIDYEVKPS